MGFIKNIWARYWTRDYQQIKDSVLTRLGANVPEITDDTENNVYVAEVDIFAGVHEMVGYYVDNAGRESFIDSCRIYRSAISHSRLLDYKVIGNIPYSTNVQFTLNHTNTTGSDITIPVGTILSNGSIRYVTQAVATIHDGDSVSNQVGSSQYALVTGVSLGVSTALANMLVVFSDKIAHDSIIFYVDAIAWTSVETMAYSTPAAEVFVQTVDKDGAINIYTGNGTMYGAIPGVGLPMTADYKVTLGAAGFVDQDTLTTIVSALTLPVGYTATVTNPQRASGGSDVETLAQLKDHIPMSVRTLNRAVTFDDYSTVAEMCPGVQLAGTYFNCGKKVAIYIVPDGGGIASSVLITTCQAYMDKRKMITTNVIVKPAGEIHMLLAVAVTAANNYLNAVVQTNVENALLAWNSVDNQKIDGTVYISDLYEKIEAAAGVVHSVITLFKAVPYARPSDTTTSVLNWTRSINNTSVTTYHWHILFTDSTHYQLIRNGSLLSSGNAVGSTITAFEMTLKVTAGSYTAGDDFEFVSYPYTPTNYIQLDEPSLPVSLIGDLTITVTGGL